MMKSLLEEIRQCRVCSHELPLGPNPVVSADITSKIIIIGQAPGTRVHRTGIPWNDPSGDQLRKWLDLDKEAFYNAQKIAIMPMGFCYPGKGKSGDLPPRKECAPLWHDKIVQQMPNANFVLLIGQYAQRYYLGANMKKTLTETVRSYQEYLPTYMPLPHPSPRNRLWLKRNEWFERDVVPFLQKKLKEMI